MASNKRNLCYLPMAAHRASNFSRHVFMAGKRNALIMDDLGHSPYTTYGEKTESPSAKSTKERYGQESV